VFYVYTMIWAKLLEINLMMMMMMMMLAPSRWSCGRSRDGKR